MIVAVNPSDLNLQNEHGENEKNLQPVLKGEQQVKTNLSKIEKKFRAKISWIKLSVNHDGTTLYSCSECNSRLSDMSNIERHIQAHLRVCIMCLLFLVREYAVFDEQIIIKKEAYTKWNKLL